MKNFTDEIDNIDSKQSYVEDQNLILIGIGTMTVVLTMVSVALAGSKSGISASGITSGLKALGFGKMYRGIGIASVIPAIAVLVSNKVLKSRCNE